MKTITYGVHRDTGLVISRVDSEIAYPILKWDDMKPENGFMQVYGLETTDVFALSGEWHEWRWTKKIPLELKNIHRQHWGLPKLKAA